MFSNTFARKKSILMESKLQIGRFMVEPIRKSSFQTTVLRSFLPLFTTSIFISPNLVAEETPDGASIWSGESELGFVLTDGNTETHTINGKLGLTGDGEIWRKKVGFEVLGSSQNDETSAEKYSAEGQLDRKFANDTFLFGNLSYSDDRFSGFDFESSVSSGMGKTLINNEKTNLVVEAGPGVRVSKPKDGSSEEEATLGLGLDYKLNFSETAKFSQSFDVDVGEDRTVTTSVSGLTSQMVGNLAMKFTLTVKHNSDPVVDSGTGQEKESTDTETAVTVVYSF